MQIQWCLKNLLLAAYSPNPDATLLIIIDIDDVSGSDACGQ